MEDIYGIFDGTLQKERTGHFTKTIPEPGTVLFQL